MTTVILKRKELIEQIELALTRLNVIDDTQVKLDVRDNTLVVTPVFDQSYAQDPEFQSALKKTKTRYTQALRNLAK